MPLFGDDSFQFLHILHTSSISEQNIENTARIHFISGCHIVENRRKEFPSLERNPLFHPSLYLSALPGGWENPVNTFLLPRNPIQFLYTLYQTSKAPFHCYQIQQHHQQNYENVRPEDQSALEWIYLIRYVNSHLHLS